MEENNWIKLEFINDKAGKKFIDKILLREEEMEQNGIISFNSSKNLEEYFMDKMVLEEDDGE